MESLNDKFGLQEEKQKSDNVRGEIDTSAPFESVKEAATRFGGIGFWRPTSCKHSAADNASSEHESELVDITKLEEEAAQLEKDLIVKERETLDVLKELENTKLLVEELKLKVQKEVSDVNVADPVAKSVEFVHSITEEAEKESHRNLSPANLCPSSAPGLILMELKQAKLNLTRTTNDLVDIRTAVESYKQKIEKERVSLEKTRRRLSLNVSKVSSLENELNEKRRKLEVVNDDNPMAISMELQRLTSETEEFKKMGEIARSEILKAMSEIEETKSRLRTAEIRLVAARKMKEAARASEAVALAEIEAISSSEKNLSSEGIVTLTFEQYTSLMSKAQEASEASKTTVVNAMLQVEEANVSKNEILKKVEEATKEVTTSKKALEEALGRVEAANKGKLAVEEALRIWRSERGRKRRSIIHNNTKFKNSSASHRGKDSTLLDVNGINLVNDEEIKPVLRSTLSIGQILSRKLLLTEEYDNGMQGGKRKVSLSLGQMLGKTSGELESSCSKGGDKENNNPKRLLAKRKKFGFGKISSLVAKQSKKKKKRTQSSSMCRNV